MKLCKIISTRVVVLSTLFFLFSTATAAPTPAASEEMMGRFVGTSEGNIGGQKSTIISVQLLSNSRNVQIAVPNETARAVKGAPAAAPIPKRDLMTVITKLKPGSIIKFTAEASKAGPVPELVTIEGYDAKPGEDTPNGYVYAKTYDKPTGKITLTLVVLTKFGVEHQFTLPLKKNEKGEQEQDPDLVAQLSKIPIGSSVWIASHGAGSTAVLTAIEPYIEPQIGKISKIGDTEIDGKKVPSADIETDSGKTVTVLVPMVQKGTVSAPDTVLRAALHKFKAGSQVTFRTHEDGDKLWLREISAAPKAAAAAVEKDKKMETPAKKGAQ